MQLPAEGGPVEPLPSGYRASESRSDALVVRFWGVRGSIAVSGARYLHTGGNTSCVELAWRGERLVLDGGTGLRALGDQLGFVATRLSVLFSHTHWDHIQGVPFFTPAFHPGSELRLVGPARPSGTLRQCLARQMRPPQFPVTLDAFRARIEWGEVRGAAPFEIGPFSVTPAELSHPNGILAYRVEVGGRAVVYATDHEHGEGIDDRLVELARGADLLIHDAQYTRAEYRGEVGQPRTGWGHSAWEQAVECAELAGARRLALFHHDPGRDDDGVAAIEARAQERLPGAFAAREGRAIRL